MKTSRQKIPAAGCAIRRILTDTGAAIVADDIYLDGGLREYEAFHVILTGTVSGCIEGGCVIKVESIVQH